MCVRNEIDRYHLAIDVLDRVPRLAGISAHIDRNCRTSSSTMAGIFANTAKTCRRLRIGAGRPSSCFADEHTVLNAGSSSLKFDVFEMSGDPGSGKLLTKGAVQRMVDMRAAMQRPSIS